MLHLAQPSNDQAIPPSTRLRKPILQDLLPSPRTQLFSAVFGAGQENRFNPDYLYCTLRACFLGRITYAGSMQYEKARPVET